MTVLADVLPLPTGVVDYLYLGPLGIAVGALLLVGAVWIARTMRRRGRGRGVALAAAVLFFIVGDLIAYFLAITVLRPQRSRPIPPPVTMR